MQIEYERLRAVRAVLIFLYSMVYYTAGILYGSIAHRYNIQFILHTKNTHKILNNYTICTQNYLTYNKTYCIILLKIDKTNNLKELFTMTDKEMKKLKDTLPKWENGKPPVLTKEQKLLDRKLWCVEMINSILTYNGKENIMSNEYLKSYIEELGIETIEELVSEQIKDFEKAIVLENVHIDCEGLSYNSIIWADEM